MDRARSGQRTRRRGGWSAVVVLCIAWVALIVAARATTSLATDDEGTVLTGPSALVIAVSFVGVTLLLSFAGRAWATGEAPPENRDATGGAGDPSPAGDIVAGIVFALVAAGLVADGRMTVTDAAAAFLTLSGAIYIVRGWRYGLVQLGWACGLSPICTGAIAVVLLSADGRGRRWGNVCIVVGIGLATALVAEWVFDRSISAAFYVGGDVARTGPQNVWRFVARWLDLVMPALVPACLAAADWYFGKPEPEIDVPWHASRAWVRALSVWLMINCLVGAAWPRGVVGHGLLLALPAFLLVPAGWQVLRRLPFDRSEWTLSCFSLACRVLPFALLWAPLRRAGELAIVAWFGA